MDVIPMVKYLHMLAGVFGVLIKPIECEVCLHGLNLLLPSTSYSPYSVSGLTQYSCMLGWCCLLWLAKQGTL